MGPPIFIGGKAEYPKDQYSPYLCFNGATDFHRWKETGCFVRARDKLSLQWGHRFSSVERIEVGKTLLDDDPSSMGPPIFIGGKNTLTIRSLRAMTLQWGHRFSSVERTRCLPDAPVPQYLQWGHRFSSVESPGEILPLCATISLQWGHRFSSVER